MKKLIKRGFAALLALTLALGMSVSAFAIEGTTDTATAVAKKDYQLTNPHQSHPCLGTTVYHRDYLLPAVSKAAAIFHFPCIYAHFFTISRAISYIYCMRCAIPFFTIATSHTIPFPVLFYSISVIFLCQGFSPLIFLYYADRSI